jgi:hypothetical protein
MEFYAIMLRLNKTDRHLKKQKSDIHETSRLIQLEGENLELFQRLTDKLPRLSENDLINAALRSLERKTNRIIKRQLVKKVKLMTDRGLQPQQIASRLNEKKIPTIGESKKWEWTDILWLLDKDPHRDEPEVGDQY